MSPGAGAKLRTSPGGTLGTIWDQMVDCAYLGRAVRIMYGLYGFVRAEPTRKVDNRPFEVFLSFVLK